MILKKLVEFLDENHIKYVNVTHSTAFTAQDVAQSAHISGKEMAKAVIVWMDGEGRCRLDGWRDGDGCPPGFLDD